MYRREGWKWMSLNMVHTVAVLKASELLVALVKDAGGAGPGLAGPSCAYRVTCGVRSNQPLCPTGVNTAWGSQEFNSIRWQVHRSKNRDRWHRLMSLCSPCSVLILKPIHFLVQFSIQVCQVRRWMAESSLLFCSVCQVLLLLYDELVPIVQENECHRWKCKSLQLTITLLLGNCWFVCHLFIAICSAVFLVDVITQHTKHKKRNLQPLVSSLDSRLCASLPYP